MNKTRLYFKAIFCLTVIFLLNGCVFIEVLFENKKKSDCPLYYDEPTANPFRINQKKKGKKNKNDPNADPKAGTVVTATGDSVNLDVLNGYVPRTQNGLVDKKKPKAHKKNPDPRQGYPKGYKPKRKPANPEKHY